MRKKYFNLQVSPTAVALLVWLPLIYPLLVQVLVYPIIQSNDGWYQNGLVSSQKFSCSQV